MEPTDTAVERGSGNVFADLGFPDAGAHLVKAGLVSRIASRPGNYVVTDLTGCFLKRW